MAISQFLLARLGRHASAHSYRVLVLGISETGDRLKGLPANTRKPPYSMGSYDYFVH
ncbi:uncharacterized protein CLUP02_01519 [Colletotrichum lupini]|uniref:Uncharacterized protein n=1 Tax=Colletotrichum lupini TaxID=145971 RepID=A0A9Q8SE58_9PEZI|nr:uncharacterized protein CLUP02_01519 [Colletotrichum lupini]UQC74867.1 hypothetical protein CLUP02_01519 [Colletotrichum lupini]